MLTTIKYSRLVLIESSHQNIRYGCHLHRSVIHWSAIGFTITVERYSKQSSLDAKTIFWNLLHFATVIQYQTSNIQLYSTVYQEVGVEPGCCTHVENWKRRHCSGWHKSTSNKCVWKEQRDYYTTKEGQDGTLCIECSGVVGKIRDSAHDEGLHGV